MENETQLTKQCSLCYTDATKTVTINEHELNLCEQCAALPKHILTNGVKIDFLTKMIGDMVKAIVDMDINYTRNIKSLKEITVNAEALYNHALTRELL